MRWPRPPSSSPARAGSRGLHWAYEVHPPANVDCTIGVPENTLPIGEWLRRGFVPAYGRTLSAAERAQPASLLQPAGLYGPSFLATKNYFVIKEYNFSDLYVLFVGHLSDLIADPRPFETPWGKVAQLPTRDLDRMQQILTARGYYHDKIDGKAGMKTRAALGDYQKRNGLKVDCWPTAARAGADGSREGELSAPREDRLAAYETTKSDQSVVAGTANGRRSPSSLAKPSARWSRL